MASDSVNRDPSPLLAQLMEIHSVGPAEGPLAEYIEAFLRPLGFNLTRVPVSAGRWNIIARLGESRLGFYGHMDTVPPAPDYAIDPFRLHIDGDTGRGLGAVDMKGGLSCMLRLAEVASASQLPLTLIFGVDEENISEGAHALVSAGALSNLEFLVVAESGQIVDFDQDFSLCYGRKGRIVLEVEVHGRKAHAASAAEGINAVSRAAALVLEVERTVFPSHTRLGATNVVVQEIEAQADSFSVPDRCRFRLSLMTSPGYTSEQFQQHIVNIARELGIDVAVSPVPRTTPYGESYEVDRSNPFLRRLESDVFSKFRVAPLYTPSVADENVFANRLGIPVISIGPIGAGDHTAKEWVRISSLSRVVAVYEMVLRSWQE